MADKEEEGELIIQDPEKLKEAPEVASGADSVQDKTCLTILEPTATSETNIPGNTGTQLSTKDKKIDVFLKATGDAPIMKKKKWSVSQDYPIGRISEFIKKYIKLNSDERLFLYINQRFAPSPDQTVKNLYDCYGSDGKLIIHYSKSPAWG